MAADFRAARPEKAARELVIVVHLHPVGDAALTSPSRSLESVIVQVFGRWNAETIRALWRPASEKRHGRKSRSVVQRRCGVRYGELAARPSVRSLNWSGCRAMGLPPSMGSRVGVNGRSAR